jgi:nitroreductase
VTPALFRELVAEARFSPSVHNVQPTRWRLRPDGVVWVLDAPERRLPVGDPTGRDALASHGAAVEGFAIAASVRGFKVSVAPVEGAVAQLTLSPGARPDPLASFLQRRRTYRGPFRNGAGAAELATLAAACRDLLLVNDADRIAAVARLNDAASLRTFRRRDFRLELLSWMRLSRNHPDWSRDGLNAEAMNMSPAEALGAGIALRPSVFEALDRMGVAGPITGEAAVVRSALSLAVFAAGLDEPPFDTGRRWHRAWLEIERVGLSAAPMTVLGDDPEAAAAVAQCAGVPEGSRVVTVFRLGVPAGRIPQPARLPVDELIAP